MAVDSGLDKEVPLANAARGRVLLAGCIAHVTHDGFTDMLYLFFPVWRQAFALNFSQVGLLKTLYSGAMSAFQMPCGMIAGRVGILKVLVLGTILTSLSLSATGLASSPVLLCLFLALGGMGSSTQHPLSSSAISNAYSARASRVALSTYNFSGDLGKLILPPLAALLIAYSGWEKTIGLLGLCGLLGAAAILALLSGIPLEGNRNRGTAVSGRFSFLFGNNALPFASLSLISIIDSAVRTGFLTFLPFLLQGKGADTVTVGVALSLIFAGGAVGKFVCGAAAASLGILRTVIATELATALCIYGSLTLRAEATLLLCPFLGIALNGTSSVLYGSVPELVADASRNEAFAFFYSCTIGASALSPAFFGMVSDSVGVKATIAAVAALAITAIPLTALLRGRVGKGS